MNTHDESIKWDWWLTPRQMTDWDPSWLTLRQTNNWRWWTTVWPMTKWHWWLSNRWQMTGANCLLDRCLTENWQQNVLARPPVHTRGFQGYWVRTIVLRVPRKIFKRPRAKPWPSDASDDLRQKLDCRDTRCREKQTQPTLKWKRSHNNTWNKNSTHVIVFVFTVLRTEIVTEIWFVLSLIYSHNCIFDLTSWTGYEVWCSIVFL